MKICNQVPHTTVEPAKKIKEQPKNPKHTGKSYEIDDDTTVQAPLDLDLPVRDEFDEDVPPTQELLDHGGDPLPVTDDPEQQEDKGDLAITQDNEQEEDGSEVHTQELPNLRCCLDGYQQGRASGQFLCDPIQGWLYAIDVVFVGRIV